ncbi:hypothetical protein F2P79_013131 [Pimephales promelas]|nr:hypothetical protein F2P79_013131 [Pimephales promelas]
MLGQNRFLRKGGLRDGVTRLKSRRERLGFQRVTGPSRDVQSAGPACIPILGDRPKWPFSSKDEVAFDLRLVQKAEQSRTETATQQMSRAQPDRQTASPLISTTAAERNIESLSPSTPLFALLGSVNGGIKGMLKKKIHNSWEKTRLRKEKETHAFYFCPQRRPLPRQQVSGGLSIPQSSRVLGTGIMGNHRQRVLHLLGHAAFLCGTRLLKTVKISCAV